MSISLLKRYKNEIRSVLNSTKKRINVDSLSNTFYFYIKYPWNKEWDKEGYFYAYAYFGRGIKFENLLKVVGDDELVYIGVYLDDSVKNAFLDDSFGKYFNGKLSISNIEREACKYFRDLLFYEFRHIENSCVDRDLSSYKSDFVLNDINDYIAGEIFEVGSNGSILYKDIDSWGLRAASEKFILKNYNKSVIKDNKYYKLFVKEIESTYSDIELTLADGEFPKVKNRKFLPIVTINFNKNEISYMYDSRFSNKIGVVNVYKKGLNHEDIQTFLSSTVKIIPPLGTVSINYKGKEIRMNGVERDVHVRL